VSSGQVYHPEADLHENNFLGTFISAFVYNANCLCFHHNSFNAAYLYKCSQFRLVRIVSRMTSQNICSASTFLVVLCKKNLHLTKCSYANVNSWHDCTSMSSYVGSLRHWCYHTVS